jgi:hypothetical protein
MKEVLRTHRLGFADAARLALQAEGIDAVLFDEHALGFINLAGEIRVMVPESDVDWARAVLAELEPPTKAAEAPRSWRWQRLGLIALATSLAGGFLAAALTTGGAPQWIVYGALVLAVTLLLLGLILLVTGMVIATRERSQPMEELALPGVIRRKASITPGGEHAWRMEDVEETIAAAANAGLACLGGQVQFQLPGATCEAYWLNYDPTERQANEPWKDYVCRAAEETREAFRRLCRETDFREVAREWEFMRTKIDREGYDPMDDVWFVLDFVSRLSYARYARNRARNSFP